MSFIIMQLSLTYFSLGVTISFKIIILKCFIQFICTNLDGSLKEGVTF